MGKGEAERQGAGAEAGGRAGELDDPVFLVTAPSQQPSRLAARGADSDAVRLVFRTDAVTHFSYACFYPFISLLC